MWTLILRKTTRRRSRRSVTITVDRGDGVHFTSDNLIGGNGDEVAH